MTVNILRIDYAKLKSDQKSIRQMLETEQEIK